MQLIFTAEVAEIAEKQKRDLLRVVRVLRG
jgi:hypothetical protein